MSEFWVRTGELDAVGSELRAAAAQARNSAGDIGSLVSGAHLAESGSPHQAAAGSQPQRLSDAADTSDANWATVIREIDALAAHRISTTSSTSLDEMSCHVPITLPVVMPSQWEDAYDVPTPSTGQVTAMELMAYLRNRGMLPEPSPEGLTDPFSATDRLWSSRGAGETTTSARIETSAGLDALGWAEILATAGLELTFVRHADGYVEVTVGVIGSADPELSPNITIGPGAGTVDVGIDVVGGAAATWIFDSEVHFQQWVESVASVLVDMGTLAAFGLTPPTPEEYLERIRSTVFAPASVHLDFGANISAGVTGTLPLSVFQLIAESDVIVGLERFEDGTMRVEIERGTTLEGQAATVLGGYAAGSYTRRDFIYFDGIVPIASERIYEVDATFGPELAGSLGVGWGIKASEALAYARRSGDDPGTLVIALETRYDGSLLDIVSGETTTTTIAHIDGSSVEAAIETQVAFGEIDVEAGAEHTTVESHSLDAGLDDIGIAILRYLGLRDQGSPVAP